MQCYNDLVAAIGSQIVAMVLLVVASLLNGVASMLLGSCYGIAGIVRVLLDEHYWVLGSCYDIIK